jgi:RecB family exonuclease
MNRIVVTDPVPEPPVSAKGIVITPHQGAAAAVGAPYRDLRYLAKRALIASGKRVAPAMRARKALRDVIHRIKPGADPSAVASRIGEILSTVLRTGINLDDLSANGSRRVQELARIAAGYIAELDRMGLIDESTLLLIAAEHIEAIPDLVIYGYHRARTEEIRFINAAAGEGSRLYLPIAEAGDFDSNREWLNFLLNEGWTEETSPNRPEPASVGAIAARRFLDEAARVPTASAVAYQDKDDEVRGVLAAVKALANEGIRLSSIAMVCEDINEYVHLISGIGEEYGLPVSINHSVPLGQTTVGGLVKLIFDVAGNDFEFEACVRLLQHRLGPGFSEGKWAETRRTRPPGRAEWEASVPVLACMNWPDEQTVHQWCGTLRKCLEAFEVRVKCSHSPSDLTAFNGFLDTLRELSSVEGGQLRPRDYFIATNSDLLSTTLTPFSTAKGGAILHSTRTIVGAKFDHVFVLGMAEGSLPSSVSENPVVDFYERGELAKAGVRFETAAEVARWDRLAFYFTLLTAEKSIAFTYPKSIEDKEKIASSYFAKLGLTPDPARAERHIPSSIEELRRAILTRDDSVIGDDVLPDAILRYGVELGREISRYFDEFDGVTGTPIDPNIRTWSVSQLTALGQCPFRWFAGKILKLAPPDEFATELDPAARGSLYHKVLELAVLRAKDAPDLRAAVLDVLHECFAEAETSDEIKLPVRLNWEVEREEHLRHLRKAVMAPDFIKDGARVLSTEEKYEGEWKAFRLMGYIDRIDETAEGLIAIDYKTSSVAPKGVKDADGKLSIDIQLPLYTHVALGALYPGKPLGKGSYYSLTKGKTLKEVDNEYPPELDEFYERARAILEMGAFAVDPDTERHACTYCDVKSVCRVGSRVGHKSGIK